MALVSVRQRRLEQSGNDGDSQAEDGRDGRGRVARSSGAASVNASLLPGSEGITSGAVGAHPALSVGGVARA